MQLTYTYFLCRGEVRLCAVRSASTYEQLNHSVLKQEHADTQSNARCLLWAFGLPLHSAIQCWGSCLCGWLVRATTILYRGTILNFLALPLDDCHAITPIQKRMQGPKYLMQ